MEGGTTHEYTRPAATGPTAASFPALDGAHG
jgi:hypothetical protein